MPNYLRHRLDPYQQRRGSGLHLIHDPTMPCVSAYSRRHGAILIRTGLTGPHLTIRLAYELTRHNLERTWPGWDREAYDLTCRRLLPTPDIGIVMALRDNQHAVARFFNLPTHVINYRLSTMTPSEADILDQTITGVRTDAICDILRQRLTACIPT